MTEAFTFSVADIPDEDLLPPGGSPLSDMPKATASKRPAKKAEPVKATGAGAKELNTAMAGLRNGNRILGFAFGALGGVAAKQAWEAELPDLEENTLAILQQDPKLAADIAKLGAKGGSTALIIAYGMAALTPVGVIQVQRKTKATERAERIQRARAEAENASSNGDPRTDPDAIFKRG